MAEHPKMEVKRKDFLIVKDLLNTENAFSCSPAKLVSDK